ncbi:MAG: helix-turn-helix transcriptional regulator [Candidatus Dactylopiibacterium carminicum]|uniref:DNA-binding response regulator n=1 Tax=Candidatus Dactylopiibacterium carminicum TaxID=857335 RepID=A0A272EZS4_9RHOO|nr:response regulator transcription factor [Candidatus Dactylopiibacterium carminicum]KAF7600636.1 DNA-binding response regulator [Candidatus Dactylopiibacterium carminicum]PAS95130.1 MAG: helix-turn-helix transcriptional regulator [Candidatus Dactylopiibacterium carminicum]PAS97934.1 MAG: helix-turn-helix transcriptional regulator [Candidatus Dactylopiibacterium carminicum]PAT00634.1 MAG: hypothetical protein BSR46_01775 [Candidatus Dactylopiibacterium carminicum]
MSHASSLILTTSDATFERFRHQSPLNRAMRSADSRDIDTLPARSLVVIDLDLARTPPASQQASWRARGIAHRLIVASKNPSDDEGLIWLDLGAAGYCHALASDATLRQVLDVVISGELWVGRSLMNRLLKGVGSRTHQVNTARWAEQLTPREQEVARRVAEGESNLTISQALGITERTVKAHLTTIFEKIQMDDRLHLALKIHGIR